MFDSTFTVISIDDDRDYDDNNEVLLRNTSRCMKEKRD